MFWKPPTDEHIVYEALSAIADGRFEIARQNTAKCTSTSRGKYYSIEFHPTSGAIMSNDNMAYYKDEVSYPMVAMLLANGTISYNKAILSHLKSIKWKDINQANKNNYMKSVNQVLESLNAEGVNTEPIKAEVASIYSAINKLKLKKLGIKTPPPKAY